MIGKIGGNMNRRGQALIEFILILPIVVIIRLYQMVEWVIRKLLKKEKQKSKTTEEKLFDLMINHLGCSKNEVK